MSAANARRTPAIPLILGPTGAGKTDLALRLAERHNLEIVSVDSAMVYRGMDIGTGKPPPDVLQRHPHHLVDILDPLQAYSAGQFVRDARRAIDDIRARGKLPLLVGGTMLYFRALRRGLADMPAADPAVRAAIDAEAALRGWPALHAELAALDPTAARRIQPNDAQRIQRALEVHRLTGKTLSELHAAQPANADLTFAAYAWVPGDRERLYAAIEQPLPRDDARRSARGSAQAARARRSARRSSRDPLRGVSPAVGTFERPRRFGFCNAARNFRDAPSGPAATDLVARRAGHSMARRS